MWKCLNVNFNLKNFESHKKSRKSRNKAIACSHDNCAVGDLRVKPTESASLTQVFLLKQKASGWASSQFQWMEILPITCVDHKCTSAEISCDSYGYINHLIVLIYKNFSLLIQLSILRVELRKTWVTFNSSWALTIALPSVLSLLLDRNVLSCHRSSKVHTVRPLRHCAMTDSH